jgi:hypothetical protein
MRQVRAGVAGLSAKLALSGQRPRHQPDQQAHGARAKCDQQAVDEVAWQLQQFESKRRWHCKIVA